MRIKMLRTCRHRQEMIRCWSGKSTVAPHTTSLFIIFYNIAPWCKHATCDSWSDHTPRLNRTPVEEVLFFFCLNLTFFSWTWQISRGIFHLGNKYPGTIWSRSCLKRRRESKVLFWNAERKEKLHYSPSYYSRTLNIYKRFYLLGFDGNKTGQIRSKNIPP